MHISLSKPDSDAELLFLVHKETKIKMCVHGDKINEFFQSVSADLPSLELNDKYMKK